MTQSTQSTPERSARKLRVLTLAQLAEELGVTVRAARDWLALHGAQIRSYQHPRSTIRLISADDVDALIGAQSQGGTTTTARVPTEPATVDDALAAVGLRRAGGAR